ncbi:MAG: metal-sensitive transcriptional regulator [Peptococcaceae bacterium]|nr:metal-sensitive transcriptional regulator [Peptococcaceae bacterium]
MDDNDAACCQCQTQGKRTSHHSDKTIKELVNRMNRIEGQLRGIKGMIERHVYCDDVLNQVASVQSALHGVTRLLLEKHLKSCVQEQLQDGNEAVIDEVLATIYKMMR